MLSVAVCTFAVPNPALCYTARPRLVSSPTQAGMSRAPLHSVLFRVVCHCIAPTSTGLAVRQLGECPVLCWLWWCVAQQRLAVYHCPMPGWRLAVPASREYPKPAYVRQCLDVQCRS